MKYFFVAFLLCFLYSCKGGNKTGSSPGVEEAVKDSVPACVRKLITDSEQELPPNPPLQIEEYLYKGKKTFLFTADCCDFFNTLYDDSCKMICAPTGGITGKGDWNCPDFAKEATLVKTIWKRTAK